MAPIGTILAISPDRANDSDVRQDLDVTNFEHALLQAGSHSTVSPVTQSQTATSVLAPQSSTACTTSAVQLQRLPPSSLAHSQSRAASGDSSLQVHLLTSATTRLDARHTPTPDGAELQNDPGVIAAVANGAFAAQAEPATTVVKENPAAQSDLATTVVQENPAAQADRATTVVTENPAAQVDLATTDVQATPAAQADLATTSVPENAAAPANSGTAAPTWPQQRVASLNERSSSESASHRGESSVWSKGDELQVDEATSELRHAAARDGYLQQCNGTGDSAALDAAGVQPLMHEEQEDIYHDAGMPVAAVLLRQHSYIQQAADMAPVAKATMSPTGEERCDDALVGSQVHADSLHREHDAEASLHGHVELQLSHASSTAVSMGGDKADGQISQLPESASQPSTPAHQPHVHAHQSSVSANEPSVYARQVSMSACEAALASQQAVPAQQLSSSACQLSMLTSQQDAAPHLQSSADQAQAFDSAAENQQGHQQQRQNMGLLRVSHASVDNATGESCLALW